MFDGIGHWHWFALAGVLVVLEILLPGVAFLWLGMAAVATGLVVLAAPALGLELEALIFAAFAVVSVWLGRRLWRPRPADTDHPDLNRRGVEYIGWVLPLEGALTSGSGHVRIGDTVWPVRLAPDAGDLAKGARVRITGVHGAVFEAEPAEPEAETPARDA